MGLGGGVDHGLAGCYFPTRFVAEITTQRTGDYTLTYDGVLLSSNLVLG
jgi:hypothetical protein|tara:strand:- start:440 stop:586 length:147 start_codon:yes stop_codon:yes gene_type:complete